MYTLRKLCIYSKNIKETTPTFVYQEFWSWVTTKVEVNFWSVFKIVFAAQTDLQILNVIYNVTLQYGLLSLQSLGNTYNGENKLACGHKVSDWNIFVLLRCQNKTFIIMSLSYFGFSGHSLCKWEILLKCFSNFQIRN